MQYGTRVRYTLLNRFGMVVGNPSFVQGYKEDDPNFKPRTIAVRLNDDKHDTICSARFLEVIR